MRLLISRLWVRAFANPTVSEFFVVTVPDPNEWTRRESKICVRKLDMNLKNIYCIEKRLRLMCWIRVLMRKAHTYLNSGRSLWDIPDSAHPIHNPQSVALRVSIGSQSRHQCLYSVSLQYESLIAPLEIIY